MVGLILMLILIGVVKFLSARVRIFYFMILTIPVDVLKEKDRRNRSINRHDIIRLSDKMRSLICQIFI